jgi:hypothetical protein
MSQKIIRYTLLTDGSSDAALLPILTWLLEYHLLDYAIRPTWSELRELRKPPTELVDKIKWSLDLYPCEILFIHRDAENQSHSLRIAEIRKALEEPEAKGYTVPAVCVVPIRMQEAWLLIDEQAVREAANNPNGRGKLEMPRISQLENLAAPKEELYSLLRTASGLPPQRLKNFSVAERARQVAEFIDDFSPLYQLSAFQALDAELQHFIEKQGWKAS